MDFTTILLFGIFVFAIYLRFPKSGPAPNSKMPPLAPYSLPIIGHAWAFIFTDMISFIASSYEKCGNPGAFELRVFSKRWIYITDRALVRDYFKATEDQLSAFAMFDLNESFGNSAIPYPKVIDVLRPGFGLAADGYLDEFGANCIKHVKMLKERLAINEKQNERDVLEEIIRRFIDTTTAKVLLEIDMDEEGLEHCKNFESFFHVTVAAASMFPQKLVNWLTAKKMEELKRNLVKYVIRKNEEGSRLLRIAFNMANDNVNSEDCCQITEKELEGVICTLMVAGSENSAIIVSNMLADLLSNPKILKKLLEELGPLVKEKDYKGIVKNSFLDACFNESSRLSMGLVSFQRTPMNNFSLGSLVLPQNSSVILAAPILQVYGKDAEATFINPKIYHPSRFKSDGDKENQNQLQNQLLTFGASRHFCPAKAFSLALVKIALAHLLIEFKFEIVELGKLDYTAFSTFAQRKFDVIITPRQ